MKFTPEAGDADRSRTRVNLLRWMTLIAMIGVCLAWITPVLMPVILLPIAVAAVVPDGKAWFVVESSAAFGWLLAALASFSEIKPDIVEVAILGITGLGLGVSWIFRISRRVMGPSPLRRMDVGFLITPLVGFLGVMMIETDRDFRARFAMSEPALRASATSILSTPGHVHARPPGRVGLFWPTGIEEKGGCVVFWTKGGFLERLGIAYFPGGATPQTIPGLDGFVYENIRGPWWTVLNN